MYMRIYNNQLVKVFTTEDLNSSEIISKIKGREPAGFTFRDKDDNIIFHNVDSKISSRELQLMIRKLKTTTIAIKLTNEEIIEYFYSIAKTQLLKHKQEEYSEEELFNWMNENMDSGILKSSVWDKSKAKVFNKLIEEDFTIIKNHT
ncbi:MAG TPA: hypothetical protein ENK88_07165 [Campylobacterales bacterium]|nr:hypothetical protein [Campylobacterales bacterium]HHH51657.1 hypothetical protein [Campylobacterales bacterium]